MHRPPVTYSVPIVQTYAMLTPSSTIDTWLCQLADDTYQVITQILF